MTLPLRGRQVQIDTLGGQLDAVRAGRGSIAVVTGLAGMGKSALLAEAGDMAKNRGIRVFRGAGDAAGQVVPLGPLLEALVSTDDPPVDPALLRDLSQCATAVRAVLEALGKKAGPEDNRTEEKRFHDALQLACAQEPRVYSAIRACPGPISGTAGVIAGVDGGWCRRAYRVLP